MKDLSIPEAAKLLNISPSRARKLFRNQPGVYRYSDHGHFNAFVIPWAVFYRVQQELHPVQAA